MSMKKFINSFVCKFLFSVKYINLDNLYSVPRCIIAPNHSNIFDPFFIYPVSRNLSIMAKAEIFRYPLIGRLLRHYNVFPVNRNKTDSKSLFKSLRIFESTGEQELLIFPEGKVVKNQEEVGKIAKKGVVFVAVNANVPIVPVYITRRPRLFSKVSVVFGKPYFVENSILKDKSNILMESKELVSKIYALKKIAES